MTAKSRFDLTEKTALITGGSRGLGLQMAEALSSLGARLVWSARKPDELQLVQAHLHAFNALAPGFFPSRMSQRLIDPLGEKALIGNAPLRRLGDDQDLKSAILVFASDAGKHITGQVLAIDGGYTAV